jgi:hypothetical protein
LLSINKGTIDLKGGKIIPFNFKELDDIGISLGTDGPFILPIGRYLVEFYSLVEIPVAGNVELSMDGHIVCVCPQASTPTSLSGKFIINITEDNKSIKFQSNIKDQIKLSDSNLVITKL